MSMGSALCESVNFRVTALNSFADAARMLSTADSAACSASRT